MVSFVLTVFTTMGKENYLKGVETAFSNSSGVLCTLRKLLHNDCTVHGGSRRVQWLDIVS